jgi:hypothetical protein
MPFYSNATQKDLEELLLDLYEYMSDRSDVDDTDSDVDHPQGIRPNEEMNLKVRMEFIMKSYLKIDPETGEKYNFGNESSNEMTNESIQKIKSTFKRYL